MALKMPAELASATVLDPDGGKHKLGKIWKSQPVVLVFVRHFG